MNNLKRVLSLGLSGAMLAGMVTIGASAVDYKDFTDKDEVTHTEAVSTMTLLGVIAGKDTGAFDPAGTVTRAEMAKMITVALNGGKDPVLGTKSTPTYTDIGGHWAESYIEYCSSLGVINGQGDGTFAPDATVTGSQAAKMMLTALGYEANVYELVGQDWEVNTNREANDAGLYDELDDIDPSAALSRDDAAQLIYNGIQASTLVKQPSKSVTSGEITFDYLLNGPSLLESKFKVYTNYGQLVDVDEGKLVIEYDYTYANQVTVDHPSSNVRFTKVTTDYADYLGQTVKVLFKASDNVVGVAPVDANKVYTTAISAAETASSSTKIKFDGTTYTLGYDDNSTVNSVNYANAVRLLTITDGDITDSGVTSLSGSAGDLLASATNVLTGNTASYNTLSLVDNDGDGEIEYAVVREYIAGKVTYLSSTSTIVNSVEYKLSSNDVDSAIEKNGYAVITYNPFNDNYTVTALTKESGTVSVNSDASKYRMNGTWYMKGRGTLTTSNAGKTVDFYAFNGVIVYAVVSEATTIDNLVMVVKTNQKTDINAQTVILQQDGSKATVKLNCESDAAAAPTEGGLYTYEVSDDGYEFTAAATINSGSDDEYTWVAGASGDIKTTTDKPNGTIATYTLSDDAVVFVYNAAGDAKVITGKQLKKVTATSGASNDYEIKTQSLGFYVSTVDNLKRVSIIAVESNAKMPSAGNDAKTYGLIVSDAVKADDNYIEYDIWTGTEKVTVQEKKVSKLSARKQFAVVKYSAITDGVIKDVEDTTLAADPLSGWSTDTLYLASVISTSGSKLWTADSAAAGDLDSDTVYMYYDSSTTDADSIGKLSGELTVGDKVTVSGGVDKYVANIQYVIDSDGDVVFVLVDTKNLVQDAVAQNVTGYKLSRTTTPSDTGNLENVSISAATTVIGKAMTLKFTVKGSGTAQKITLTNAVLSDGTNVISTKDLAAGTYEYTIYATADAYTYALANDT